MGEIYRIAVRGSSQKSTYVNDTFSLESKALVEEERIKFPEDDSPSSAFKLFQVVFGVSLASVLAALR